MNERELSGAPLHSHSRLWNERRVVAGALSRTGELAVAFEGL